MVDGNAARQPGEGVADMPRHARASKSGATDMGMSYGAICNDCGAKFTANEGGGFVFHLLHCDRCGAERAISFDEIGEPHLRYIKGLDVPYSEVTAEHDRHIQQTYPGEPMDRDEYEAAVEQLCGQCECGGAYRFDAPPRCPECRSANLRKDPEARRICYD